MKGAAQGGLPSQLTLVGKWTKRRWTVLSVLGVGANGAVYSVQNEDGSRAAMKVCDTAGSVAFEWGLLEQMEKSKAAFPKPQCIDDSANHQALYFYVMEQVEGRPLSDVWPRLSPHDVKRVLLAIVTGLQALHRANHAFCDIKPQNILVDLHREGCIRFVDVGGVTPFGRSIRQFTPTSDGAYWGYGERRATAVYDIQAVSLMVACLDNPPPPQLGQWSLAKRQAWILQTVRQMRNRALGALLEQAILGWVRTADEFTLRIGAMPIDRTVQKTQARRRADWTERLMWASLTCAAISTASAWAVYLRGL